MDCYNMIIFLGVILCSSVFAQSSTDNSTDSNSTTTEAATTPLVSSNTPASGKITIETTTAFVPYACTQGTCNGTDSSCLKDIKAICSISAPDHACQVSIDNNTVTADCVSKPCVETVTLKCCQSAGCSSELFKSSTGNKDNNGNGIQACIATIVTLATVVMAIIN
ncbi:hypothetical protein MAR_028581 [Mya arenaria]|uniref:Uncharacterized protein n=1 Tax=Mya arenaria TaxID=6604 RepID=A0ABY7DFY3_MYAAR|nr:uncharacterized protein LOC128225198 [Mya arenaria]WAQ95891.1 hypothetical protein MAR_028581 [Mya arenaria]